MSKPVRRLTVTQITSILGRRFQVDISPRKASCLCSALSMCLCPSPCQILIVTHLAASCPMSPKANCWSGSSLQVSLSVFPLLPSLSFQSHSPVEFSSDPHPNSSDLFPSQCFSLPPSLPPHLQSQYFCVHSCDLQTYHLGCYTYILFYLLSLSQ